MAELNREAVVHFFVSTKGTNMKDFPYILLNSRNSYCYTYLQRRVKYHVIGWVRKLHVYLQLEWYGDDVMLG